MPMTFVEALRELARLDHKKFWVSQDAWPEYWWFQYGPDSPADGTLLQIEPRCSPTQDDIDSILALCGWFYMVRPAFDSVTTELTSWGWTIAPIKHTRYVTSISDKDYPTKLLAAQAALVAVVERMKQTSEEKR